MTPGTLDLVCPQGATFSRTLTWKQDGSPVNITGYTAALQVRRKHSTPDVAVSLTSGSGITLGGAAGTITFTITAATTAALGDGFYRYDLELTSGSGQVTRLIEGSFRVTPEVTR